MSKRNGTVEEAIADVPVKNAGVIPAIDARLATLRQEREQAATQAQLNDAAYQGAIQTLEKLREELEAGEQESV